MSRQEAMEQYCKSMRKGRKEYKNCVLQGKYPYPHALDEILAEVMTAGEVELGLAEIPLDQVVGTKTQGRQSSFSAGFMPMLDPDTEFALKWMDLCEAHLGDEGIRDPIKCYEYLGRFYVQEGNKRVSVLKSYQSPTIAANVIRMIPIWSAEPEILAYYEFMETYKKTGLYQTRFTRAGSFPKLQAALGYEADHVWTEDQRRAFLSGYAYFLAPYRKAGGDQLPITPADALLIWLKVYPFGDLRKLSDPQLLKTVRAVWPDIKSLTQADPITVSTEEEHEEPEKKLLGRLFRAKAPDRLNIAFVSDHDPATSDWARAHDLGRQYLETVLEDQVTVQHFDGVSGEEADAAIDRAVQNGAQVIFATTPPLIGACRKAAANYPGVRVFNCSVSMPYAGVRTYYSRLYEAKFVVGAVAGAMSRDGAIGYVSNNPVFGVPACINAFALGAQLTNPRARIKVRWSCVEKDPLEALAREGIEIISNQDLPTPDRTRENWGLCQVTGGSFRSLIAPYWHWGSVYVRLARMILGGETLDASQGKAVNYWWGMSSRAVDILLGEELPQGIGQLANILRQGIIDGAVLPFGRPLRDQDGTCRSDGSQPLTPREILHMDWLLDCVEGSIPRFDQLLPMARPMARLQAVYRDEIPPEREEVIL